MRVLTYLCTHILFYIYIKYSHPVILMGNDTQLVQVVDNVDACANDAHYTGLSSDTVWSA